MQGTPWSDEHSRAVAEAAPLVRDASRPELDRTWATIRAGLPTAERSPRRRRVRILIGAGIAGTALVAGGVAAAGVYSAHTGTYASDSEDLRLGGPGEHLDPAAPDYGEVVAQVTRDVPFPTDRDRKAFVEAEVRNDQRGVVPGESSVSTGALRFWGARSAVCAWADRWAAASTAGDVSAKTRAATMLEQAPTWPAVTDVDPKQVIRYKRIRITDPRTGRIIGQQRVADNTAAGYFPLLRDAARADDIAAMGSVLARWGACPAYGADMPDFPQAIPHE